MRYPELRKLMDRVYFSVEDLPEILKIKPESARVLCSRYTKMGYFVRLKRNFYTLEERWANFTYDTFLKSSNLLQVPSYISFMTALSFYEVTTQVQRGCFESASIKRSVLFNRKGITFHFYKLQKKYYSDFIKKDDLFIAIPEKALIDSAYLCSLGRYKIDFNALDFDKLDKKKIRKILERYPLKTKKLVKEQCRI